MNAIVINLARRSQLLVEQQIRLLGELERDERDPDRLAALFQLDSLAIRMRRNDENLLVLAGAPSRRRSGDGLPIEDVVLAAVSEIEHYQRVRTHVDEKIMVSGHAVADLIHLLAELLENAAAFSPPGSPVRVESAPFGGGVALEITDEGIGLSPGALLEVNELLAAPPELSVEASERMGLVVVSHLAARHQVRVKLRSSHVGTCAAVRIPRYVLIEEGES